MLEIIASQNKINISPTNSDNVYSVNIYMCLYLIE